MDGTVHEAEEQVVLRFERHLKHPIERVWEALTDPEHRGEWLAPGTVELQPGGSAELSFANAPTTANRSVLSGSVRAVDPPRLLEYTWTTETGHEEPVRWELYPEADGTRLVLTHTLQRPAAPIGSLDVQNLAAGSLAGWHGQIDRLALLLAGQPSAYSLAEWADLYVRYLGVGRSSLGVGRSSLVLTR
jgi:uncharacterized protein YndB with AHSA1/START domain